VNDDQRLALSVYIENLRIPNRFHQQFAQNDRMQMKNTPKNSAHARKTSITKNHGIMATDMKQRERQKKQQTKKRENKSNWKC
jgi:hypothetical protein